MVAPLVSGSRLEEILLRHDRRNPPRNDLRSPRQDWPGTGIPCARARVLLRHKYTICRERGSAKATLEKRPWITVRKEPRPPRLWAALFVGAPVPEEPIPISLLSAGPSTWRRVGCGGSPASR